MKFLLIVDIRDIPLKDKIEEDENLKFYIHEINTKYYQTRIALLPVTDYKNLSETIIKKLEGVLIHFNSQDVSPQFFINKGNYKI